MGFCPLRYQTGPAGVAYGALVQARPLSCRVAFALPAAGAAVPAKSLADGLCCCVVCEGANFKTWSMISKTKESKKGERLSNVICEREYASACRCGSSVPLPESQLFLPIRVTHRKHTCFSTRAMCCCFSSWSVRISSSSCCLY